MFKKNNSYKILRLFLENPTTEFGLREISRIAKISPASVMNYLKEFEKGKILRRYSSKNKPVYKAERDFRKFKTYQTLSIIYELEESGLIDYLWNEICPQAIILFGSYSKGEATEDSDIDLFLTTNKKEINISKFQKHFKKEIQILTSPQGKIPQHLKNNLANGIILRGHFK